MSDFIEFDTEKIDEVALAMLFFTMHGDQFGARAWKGLDWDILDRLHEKGWIGNPKSKARSVVMTEEGERLAEEYAKKHFAADDTDKEASAGTNTA